MLSHLNPASLSDVSLVSKRFHQLVTTPHAWRIAFSRFFPGPNSLSLLDGVSEQSNDSDTLHAEKRLFTRLTALASWRSEYILRTRLLRALSRGKPAEQSEQNRLGSSRSASNNVGNAQITYSSSLVSPVTHIRASFDTGLNKKLPKFIHGSDDIGAASTSDIKTGKVDSWGFLDNFFPRQFAELFPGDAQYGLGSGEMAAVPNVMDVSQTYGMVYGEGFASGLLYYRSVEEKRGRLLLWTAGIQDAEQGIPALSAGDAVCSLWISKSNTIPDLSEGLIGILSGSATGVLTAYSVGTSGVRDKRLERGEITVRWVLSPGVPIIAIAVDEQYSARRKDRNRIWAVALNALGEAYYLTDLPRQNDSSRIPSAHRRPDVAQQHLEGLAWATGRSVHWTLVEPTRRLARPDPFSRSDVDGSYSPRSSWDEMMLNPQQLAAETREINDFLQKKPKHFRKVCDGWDMRRRLEVDFAGCDENGGGEALFIIGCGLEEGQLADIKRLTRCKIKDPPVAPPDVPDIKEKTNGGPLNKSLFGGQYPSTAMGPTWSFNDTITRHSSTSHGSITPRNEMFEEWRATSFQFGGLKTPQFTTTTIDISIYATLTMDEDPLFCINGSSSSHTLYASPLAYSTAPSSPQDIPGQRARLIAVGTKTGTILLFNMRVPTASNAVVENQAEPIRIIYTDSPQISCLGLTALYLVHGGNDGLVQAWDILASTIGPIRTLNSRFSSRARRRLVQAEASPQGVGLNLFAAGAICLDPDPTVLRGMVSLGSHLRYWSYSSIAADQYKGSKRRLRRSERGSNQGENRFSGTGRGALKEYIANEKIELEVEKRNRRKEEERLAGRFGLDLLGPGASEDEILAYATMLSEEAAQSDEARRTSASEDSTSTETATQDTRGSLASSASPDAVDDDVAEAIRLSLEPNTASTPFDSLPASIKYSKKKKSSPPTSISPSMTSSASHGRGSDLCTTSTEADDLDFALQLSIAEEQSRLSESSFDEGGKGKGRAP